MAVESDSSRTVEATVSADLAINTLMAGMEGPLLERIQHGGALPDLTHKKINLYVSELARGRPAQDLASLIRHSYGRAVASRRDDDLADRGAAAD
jgi:hypothetical protein